jgi:hypothetical protein
MYLIACWVGGVGGRRCHVPATGGRFVDAIVPDSLLGWQSRREEVPCTSHWWAVCRCSRYVPDSLLG